jgi:hypothetical protein
MLCDWSKKLLNDHLNDISNFADDDTKIKIFLDSSFDSSNKSTSLHIYNTNLMTSFPNKSRIIQTKSII